MKSQRLIQLSLLLLVLLLVISACDLSHRARPAVRIVNPGRGSVHDVNVPLEVSLEPNDATSDVWQVTDFVSTVAEGGIHPEGYVYRTTLIPTGGGIYELSVRVHFIDYGWREAQTCYFMRDNGPNANPPEGWGDCSIITRPERVDNLTRTPTATATITFTPTASFLQPITIVTSLPRPDFSTPSNDGGEESGGPNGGGNPACQPPPDNCGDGVWDPIMCACGPG